MTRGPLCVGLALVGAALSVGCGGGAAGAGAKAAGRGAVTVVQAVPPRATFALRASLKKLRTGGLGDALPAVASAMKADERYRKWMSACGVAPHEVFDDVVVASGGGALLFAGELAVDKGRALSCLKGAFGARDAQFQEKPALRLDSDEGPLFAVAVGSLLVVGDEASVAEAVEGTNAPLASCLALPAEQLAIGCGATLGGKDARIALTSTGGGFGAELRVSFAAEAEAKALAADVASGRAAAVSEPKFVRDVLEGLRVSTRGTTFEARASTQGDGLIQSSYLVALATGLRHVAWSREARAYTEEARRNLTAFAAALAKSPVKASGPVFPVAPPRVPDKVPAATRLAADSEALAHPTWVALGFSPSEPLRFQYEVAPSTDRRRLVVRARGDLDGNGRSSLFEISLEVKSGAVVASPMKVVEETE